MKKINIYSFCNGPKNEIRPILKGVYCKDGFITATDAYIAFKIQDKYPSEHEDKVVTKDGEILGDGSKYIDMDSIFARYAINDDDKLLSYDMFDDIFTDYKAKAKKDKDFWAVCLIGEKAHFLIKHVEKFIKACKARDMDLYLSNNKLYPNYTCLYGKNNNGEMGLLVQMIINKELYPNITTYNID